MGGYYMNADFIKANLHITSYKIKEGTKSSYYQAEGERILPDRLSITKEEITSVRKKGRNLIHPITGQMIGTFKKDEVSPFKVYKPYTTRTQIWKKPEFPMFIGYGTLGITNDEGKISDTGDLLIFYTPDNWENIKILLFIGMGNPNDEMEAFEYANKLLGDNKL